MLYEKYNYRSILSQLSSNKNRSDKCTSIRYLNLINACLERDEKCLAKKFNKESTAYEFLKNKSQLLNMAVKTKKYVNRELPKEFTQTKHILLDNLSLMGLYSKIAKMFAEKGNFYCALEWINKVYNYFTTNPPEGHLQDELVSSITLRGEIINKRINYLSNVAKKKKENLTFKPIVSRTNQNKYYINKEWYEKYQHFISTQDDCNFVCSEKTIFPREIDNYELLSGKDMFDRNQFILENKDKCILINEDEWMFLKTKFGCTNELKARDEIDKEIVYKVLILDPNEKEGDHYYYFRPKYLCMKPNEDIVSYFKEKYKQFNGIKVYQYNPQLPKKFQKEILFDIMFFFSFTNSQNHFIHNDYLFPFNKTQITNTSQYIYGGLIYVDLMNFISIRQNEKCFLCQSNSKFIIQCKECTMNSPMSSKIEFCSEKCLNQHDNNYHKQLLPYQTFDYNTIQILRDINTCTDYNSKGLSGCTNTNKISQVNSGLQCICHCMGLVHYILNKYYLNEPLNSTNKMPLTNAFMQITEQTWNTIPEKSKLQISSDDIINIVSKNNTKYNLNNKQSKHFGSWEFILDFFHMISKELNRSNSTYYNESPFNPEPLTAYRKTLNNVNSIIENLFYIQIRHKNTCKIKKCTNTSNEYQHQLFLELNIPNRQTFRYYIKFKFFKFGAIKPEIKEFEISDSTITVGDFKKQYFTKNCVFDIIGLKTDVKHDHPRVLNDYEKLFTYWDGKIQLNFPDHEIILYESTNDHWNYTLLFVYPFTFELPKPKRTSFLDNMFSSMGCCTNCSLDNASMFKFSLNINDIMFYPMRIQINKNEPIDARDCHSLREDLFNKAGLNIPELPKPLQEKILLYEEPPTVSNNEHKYIEPVRNLSNVKENKRYYLYLAENKKNMQVYFSRYLTMEKECEIIEKESGIPLMDLITHFQVPQKDIYPCQQCKNSTVTVASISKLPLYLNILIKRIDVENNVKNSTLVEYPDVLNMYQVVDREKLFSFESETKEDDCKYELYAVNEHRGSVSDGHYVSYVKVEGDWYCFDEGSVFKDSKFKNHNSLILFYKRQNAFG